MPRPTAADLRDAPWYFCAIGPGEDGTGMVASAPFRALPDEGVMWTHEGERMAVDQFQATAVRCNEDGAPITPVQAPLSIQIQMIEAFEAQAGVRLEAHRDDLARIRQSVPDDADPRVIADAKTYDMILTGITDTRPAEAPRELPDVDKVLSRIEIDTGIDPQLWVQMTHNPAYPIEQLRAAARQMLAPVLGNIAQMEDLRIIMIPHDEIERAAAVRRWVRGAEDSRAVPPFQHPSIPGYRTSEGVVAEQNGVTILSFSDFMGTYAYAWQSDPDHEPDVGPEQETGPRF